MKPEKILYTAHATSTGGRDGTSKTDDGILDVKLTYPEGPRRQRRAGNQPRAAVRRRLLGVLHRRDEARRDDAEDRAARRHVDQRRRRHRPDPAGLRHPGRAPRQHPRHGQGGGATSSSRPRTRSARTRTRRAATSRSPSTSSDARGGVASALPPSRRSSRRTISSTRACCGVSAPADGIASPAGRRRASITVPSRQRVLRSTAQPRAARLAQRRLERSVHACRCRSRRRRCPRTPASTQRADARASAPAPLVTMATHGHARTRRSAGARARAGGSPPARVAAADAAGLPRRARSARRRPSRRRRGDTGGPCGRRAPNARCRRRRPRRRAHRARVATATASAQVLRPVGLARRRRPHRRGEHDRLRRREDALEEVRGLLERVGAVGDDDRRDLVAREVAGRRAARAGARSRSPCPCCRAARPARFRARTGRARQRAPRAPPPAARPTGRRRCRRPTPRCRRWSRRCRGRRGCAGRFAFPTKLDENTGLDVYSAVGR